MSNNLSRALVIALSCFVMLTSDAWADKPPPSAVRVRGTIESVNNDVMVVKARDGKDVTVRLASATQVAGIVPTTLADIKVGSFIGAAGMPQADGSQKAIEVHVFPESMRGTGEGFREWDVRPNSSMTNATVANMVAGNDGQTLTVKFKGGEKKLTVAPNTPVVSYVPGERSELKPGAKIFTLAKKLPDGSLEGSRIAVGRDGLTPPM
jgi:hypothetical protein